MFFLMLCPNHRDESFCMWLEGSNQNLVVLWVWLQPKFSSFMDAIIAYNEIFSAFLAHFWSISTCIFLEVSILIEKGRNWLEKSSSGREHLKCTSSGDNGWISSTLCTLDPSPKVNFSLHVLYSSLWSWVMVGSVWKWVREGCIEEECFRKSYEKDYFSVWVHQIVESEYWCRTLDCILETQRVVA